MRNIFLFIRRYSNLFLFLLLQAISVYFIVQSSKYHKAAFGNFTNQFTGRINDRYSNIENYFQLKKTNDSLIKANEVLYNKLKMDFEMPDTVTKTVIDSIRVDSLLKYRKFTYMNARVAANSVTAQNNFIVLSRGTSGNFRERMGIVDPNNAVVGIITEVSEDYSVVMSLLHKDSRISAKLFKSGETGTLNWDGKEPNILTLSGIAKGVKIAKGDTVITSGFSTTFPKGMMIGRIEGVYTEPSSNNVKIRIRSAANFYNLQYVYGIDNAQEQAINKLLDKVKKAIVSREAMSTFVKNILRFILFILFQVYVLDKIHLHQMITPYIYFMFILWLPFNMNRSAQMIIAFILGFTLDSFRHHPGFHTAACVMIAYFRPFLITLLIPQEGSDTNYDEPSIKSLGGILPYLIYVGVLSFMHNAWLFFLEAWQFGDIWYFLVKTFLSTAVCILLILITELIFSRKQRFRTNTI